MTNGNNIYNFACNATIIKNSLSEKILGITIDNNLDFSDHTSNICKTANEKLNALFRLVGSMNTDKCSLLINYFIKSHFKYKNIIYV